MGPWSDVAAFEKNFRHVLPVRLCHQRLDEEGCIDRLSRERGKRIRKVEMTYVLIAQWYVAHLEHRVDGQGGDLAPAVASGDRPALQVRNRLESAGLHQLLAGHDRDEPVVLRRDVGEIGDDANV